MLRIDRRESPRVKHPLKVSLKIRETISKKPFVFEGESIEISPFGLSISTDKILPSDNNKGLIEIQLPHSSKLVKARMIVQWRNDEKNVYGIKFVNSLENQLDDWDQLIINSSVPSIKDRRTRSLIRRVETISFKELTGLEKRKKTRRISDFLENESREQNKKSSISKSDLLPKQDDDYSLGSAKIKREWLMAKTGVNFHHIGVFSEDPKNMRSNIENFIGMAQVPIGIAGPLKINGQYAKGDFYIPMATTEGTLVNTYSKGMEVAAFAGGIRTAFLGNELHITPIFVFSNLSEATKFKRWVDANFELIKKEAEKSTLHGKLLRIDPIPIDKNVLLKFIYFTGDASGLNMVTVSTDAACKLINSIVRPTAYYLQSNYSAIKKVTAHNYITGYGRSVIAECNIPKALLQRSFQIMPKKLVDFFTFLWRASTHAGMLGVNGHAANGISAIFAACGQDLASVVESHLCIVNAEVTEEGDLYCSVKMPCLVIGTVGGGTGLSTQKECLEILDCYGEGKSEKFSEIIAATVLSGEIAGGAANASGAFAEAFKKRKESNQEFRDTNL